MLNLEKLTYHSIESFLRKQESLEDVNIFEKIDLIYEV